MRLDIYATHAAEYLDPGARVWKSGPGTRLSCSAPYVGGKKLSVSIFLGKYGTSLIGVIKGNFFSTLQRTVLDGCNGFLK